MRLFITLALALMLASPAFAEFTGPGGVPGPKGGGFLGPASGSQAETAAQAKNLPDNAPVALTGNIVSKVAGSKKKYVFKDGSGEIIVEISPKIFRGRTVTPADTVRVSGKIDQDFGKEAELEAKDLEIISR